MSQRVNRQNKQSKELQPTPHKTKQAVCLLALLSDTAPDEAARDLSD